MTSLDDHIVIGTAGRATKVKKRQVSACSPTRGEAFPATAAAQSRIPGHVVAPAQYSAPRRRSPAWKDSIQSSVRAAPAAAARTASALRGPAESRSAPVLAHRRAAHHQPAPRTTPHPGRRHQPTGNHHRTPVAAAAPSRPSTGSSTSWGSAGLTSHTDRSSRPPEAAPAIRWRPTVWVVVCAYGTYGSEMRRQDPVHTLGGGYEGGVTCDGWWPGR